MTVYVKPYPIQNEHEMSNAFQSKTSMKPCPSLSIPYISTTISSLILDNKEYSKGFDH